MKRASAYHPTHQHAHIFHGRALWVECKNRRPSTLILPCLLVVDLPCEEDCGVDLTLTPRVDSVNCRRSCVHAYVCRPPSLREREGRPHTHATTATKKTKKNKKASSSKTQKPHGCLSLRASRVPYVSPPPPPSLPHKQANASKHRRRVTTIRCWSVQCGGGETNTFTGKTKHHGHS